MHDAIIDLEARMAWYEKHIGELDGLVRQLFDEVARLRREVDALQQAAAPDIGAGSEPPPHY